MQILGFGLTKISGEKRPIKEAGLIANTNLEILDVTKEEVDMIKDSDVIKVSFKFGVSYSKKDAPKSVQPNAELSFEGGIILSLAKGESKEIVKSWKKSGLPNDIRVAVMNIIFRRCSSKALQLEDELDLPPHIPVPRVSLQDPETKK